MQPEPDDRLGVALGLAFRRSPTRRRRRGPPRALARLSRHGAALRPAVPRRREPEPRRVGLTREAALSWPAAPGLRPDLRGEQSRRGLFPWRLRAAGSAPESRR